MKTSNYMIGFFNECNEIHNMDEFDTNRLKDWEDIGFTIVMIPRYELKEEHIRKRDIILDWCRQKGVRALIRDPRTQLERGVPLPVEYEEGIKEFVKEFEGRKEVFGAYIFDEPTGKFTQTVIEAVNIFKKHSESIMPYVNFIPYWNNVPGFSNAVDALGCNNYEEYVDEYVKKTNSKLLSYDHYSQMLETGFENAYYYNLKVYSDLAKRYNIDFINIILSVGHYDYKVPTYDEFRWQVSTTLAYGAKGIFYYTFETTKNNLHNGNSYRLAPIDEYGDRTLTFDSVMRVNKEIHYKWNGIFSRLTLDRVEHAPLTPVSKVNGFSGKGIVKKVDLNINGYYCGLDGSKAILSDFIDESDGSKYVFVVNDNMHRSLNIGLHFHGVSKLYKYTAFGELVEDVITKRDGDMSVKGFWLAPGQGELLKVEFDKVLSEEYNETNVNKRDFHLQ